MTDTTHLVALETRLSNEKRRQDEHHSDLRAVWIVQIEKEIANEMTHLGMPSDGELSDDLLKDFEL